MPLSPSIHADPLHERRAWCRARKLTQHSAVFHEGATLRCPGIYRQPSGTPVVCGHPLGTVGTGDRIILKRGADGEACPNCGTPIQRTHAAALRLEATG